MSDAMPSCPIALVVAEADAERECSCRELVGSGYDPVGFSDCENAVAWLDEETPIVAIIDMPADRACSKLKARLDSRGVTLLR